MTDLRAVAKRIVLKVNSDGWEDELQEVIESLLREVVEEGNMEIVRLRSALNELNTDIVELRKEARSEALEQAAQIACDTKIWDGGVVCAQIRALKGEGK